jgi:DNA-binding NarL/FixJ family response regulator
LSRTIRIVVADDHPIFRKGLREVVDAADGFEVVAECGDGESAVAAIAEHRPDVAVLDVDMPGRDGFAVVRELRDREIETEVVLLTMHGREDLLRAAFDLGVRGYVVKDGAVLDIVEAIRAVRERRPFISSSLSALLLTGRPSGAAGSEPPPDLGRLTATERRVLRGIAEFKSSKEIAEDLGIHYRTVENHRTNIAGKLGLAGSHALSRFAARHRDAIV